MKFKLQMVSDCNFVEEVEINTLEDLERLSETYGHESLIIDFDYSPKVDGRIRIYDGYIE
jgi:hypothetical protein